MKKHIIYCSILALIAGVSISLKAISEPNFNFNRYNPTEIPMESLENAKEKILFIVDFSNSMNESLGSKRKIDVALDTLRDVLPQMSPTTTAGLRVYGHKNGFTPAQSCTASQLVTPLGTNNTHTILDKLATINATGWTPITYSLKKAVNSDFAGVNGPKRIVLLSDGGENCDESPCDYAIELMKLRDDIRIDVIAFTISDMDANDQLKCAALTTSGKFYSADTAAQLSDSLKNSLNMKKDVQGVILQK
ncbi:MAG: VWA domain-containing protein [Candidatus Gastranaerophilales bacterium]|nr:VWA domain-containing protein [Candidatus Gastranaerophilales bacterium]